MNIDVIVWVLTAGSSTMVRSAGFCPLYKLVLSALSHAKHCNCSPRCLMILLFPAVSCEPCGLALAANIRARHEDSTRIPSAQAGSHRPSLRRVILLAPPRPASGLATCPMTDGSGSAQDNYLPSYNATLPHLCQSLFFPIHTIIGRRLTSVRQ